MNTLSPAVTMSLLRRLATFMLCLAALSLTTACSDDKVEYNPGGNGNGGGGGGGGGEEEEHDYDKWIMHEPKGAVCADNTQYRYFVKRRPNTDKVLVLYEGGGACWNWETCTGTEGALGALGVDCVMRNHGKADEDKTPCIVDDYADTYYGLPAGIDDATFKGIEKLLPSWVGIKNRGVSIDTVLPLGSSGHKGGVDVSPMRTWNLVFVPYCTSDLYAGKKTAVYTNPDNPEESITFHHVGLDNSLIVAEELNEMFPKVSQFAMNGCSAGGAGVMATYHFFRSKMKGIERGYVFSDAGPFFPTTNTALPAHSAPLHAAVREAWGISGVFDMLIADRPDIIAEEPEDVSDLYSILSRTYPDDRFSVAHTQTDYNYSLYSYTSFNGMTSRARSSEEAKKIYQFWADDNSNLVDVLEPLDNFAYYLPFWRRTNDSHCISLLGIEDIDKANGDEVMGLLGVISKPVQNYYAGTEIEVEEGVIKTYRDHAYNVLNDDEPLESHIELEADDYMGLRKFCTPDLLDSTKCQCAFGEYEKAGEGDEDFGNDLCSCLRRDESRTNASCEPILDCIDASADPNAVSICDCTVGEGKSQDLCECLAVATSGKQRRECEEQFAP